MTLASRFTATPRPGDRTPPDPHGRAGMVWIACPSGSPTRLRQPATFPGCRRRRAFGARRGGAGRVDLLESEVGVLPDRSGGRPNPQAIDPHPLEAVSEPEPQAVG